MRILAESTLRNDGTGSETRPEWVESSRQGGKIKVSVRGPLSRLNPVTLTLGKKSQAGCKRRCRDEVFQCLPFPKPHQTRILDSVRDDGPKITREAQEAETDALNRCVPGKVL